ncbi:MAG: alpha/beta fold hydrolase [Bacteroidales bacterium]|nr:MAG: alpha/beta fold hydrolase [Bacteroidales bacterium]
MKRKALLIFLGVMVASFPVFSQKFPAFAKGIPPKDGEIVIKHGFYKNTDDKKYPKKLKADFITMAVRENRNDPKSRIITIPVLRIYSLSKTPNEPIFSLSGGPGTSNINNFVPFLIDQHDIVMVGYRGVDGSTDLSSKAIAEAIVVDSNTYSVEHLRKVGSVITKEFDRFTNQGIDINSYNILEVVDDIENARSKLGFGKINLCSYSFGTRLAYVYALRHPESINRSLCAFVLPPGHMCFNPDVQDNILKEYGKLWKDDTSNLKRTADIIKTIKDVFATMPLKWRKIIIDPAKVRMMMKNYMNSTNGTAKIFDAFIAAENGDYSGLACLVMMYDLIPEMGTVWSELIMKGVTADYVAGKNYTAGLDSKENLLGAPMSKIFAMVDFSGYKFRLIPEKYRRLDTSYVSTLLMGANLDISTPLVNIKELMPYIPNGKLVEVSDFSHADLWVKQEVEFIAFVKEYFLTGQIKEGYLKHIPANLSKPAKSLQKEGKKLYTLKKLGLLRIIVRMMV